MTKIIDAKCNSFLINIKQLSNKFVKYSCYSTDCSNLYTTLNEICLAHPNFVLNRRNVDILIVNGAAKS